MQIRKIRPLWIDGAVLAGLAAIAGGFLFFHNLSMQRDDGGGRATAGKNMPPPHFTDVRGAVAGEADYLFARGITEGCGPTTFCPNDDLVRSTAAVLIIRAIYSSIHGPGSANADNFTYTASPYFTDVPATHTSFKWIQKMKDLGITRGCTLRTYCPDDKTHNFEMAAFATRARQFLMTGLATPRTFSYRSEPYFRDETPESDPVFFPYIQRAAELRVFGTPPASGGCGSGKFCPADYTTRAQSLPYIIRGILGDLSF